MEVWQCVSCVVKTIINFAPIQTISMEISFSAYLSEYGKKNSLGVCLFSTTTYFLPGISQTSYLCISYNFYASYYNSYTFLSY